MQEGEALVLVVSTIVIGLAVVFLIILFTVFQHRKNKLLKDRADQKKQFEKEIAETQIEIREETLRNISWELHDNIGQLLTLAKIQIQNATLDTLPDISETISKSLTEIRALSKSINPEFINTVKLKEALRLEIERFNRLKYINASLEIKGAEREINQKHGIIIFRMLQEFFSNTIKHSKGTNLWVVLDYEGDRLKIEARDNGVGFDMDQVLLKGIGLENIKVRAKLIGAEAQIVSTPNNSADLGTVLNIIYYI